MKEIDNIFCMYFLQIYKWYLAEEAFWLDHQDKFKKINWIFFVYLGENYTKEIAYIFCIHVKYLSIKYLILHLVIEM